MCLLRLSVTQPDMPRKKIKSGKTTVRGAAISRALEIDATEKEKRRGKHEKNSRAAISNTPNALAKTAGNGDAHDAHDAHDADGRVSGLQNRAQAN